MITLRNPINLQALKDFNVVRPARAGSKWMGVPHYDVANALIDSINTSGISVTNSTFSLRDSKKDAMDNARMAGVIRVQFPVTTNVPAINGMEYSIGILNTNDLSKAIRIFCGGYVAVCTNGLIIGQLVFKHKHTTGLSLSDEFKLIGDKIIEKSLLVEKFVNTLKSADLKDNSADHILMEAARKGAILWPHLRTIWNEYKNTSFPTNDDFRQPTAWSLYNAATFVTQKRSEQMQAASIHKLRDVFLTKVG